MKSYFFHYFCAIVFDLYLRLFHILLFCFSLFDVVLNSCFLVFLDYMQFFYFCLVFCFYSPFLVYFRVNLRSDYWEGCCQFLFLNFFICRSFFGVPLIFHSWIESADSLLLISLALIAKLFICCRSVIL